MSPTGDSHVTVIFSGEKCPRACPGTLKRCTGIAPCQLRRALWGNRCCPANAATSCFDVHVATKPEHDPRTCALSFLHTTIRYQSEWSVLRPRGGGRPFGLATWVRRQSCGKERRFQPARSSGKVLRLCSRPPCIRSSSLRAPIARATTRLVSAVEHRTSSIEDCFVSESWSVRTAGAVSLCVCVSLGLCLGLSVSLCLCVCVCRCVCVPVCLCRCVSVSLCVCVSAPLSVSLCLSLSASVFVSASLSESLSVCLCLSVSVSLFLCVSVSPCLRVSVSLCVCVSVRLCVCVSVCLCVCVSVSLCV